MSLRMSMDRLPAGSVFWGSADERGRVLVIGYIRPANADEMTIPPFREEELLLIAAGRDS